MEMLPIYILGALTNALVSSVNARKQLKNQNELAHLNIDAQRSNVKLQLEQQRQLHSESYKQQIANQLRTFALSVTWPLDTAPDHIADMLDNYANVPLILIIAPSAQNGIQKELQAVWKNLGLFFMATFMANSETPVIQIGYKNGIEPVPMQDIHKVYNGLKSIPVLYVSPYSTDRDSVLGMLIAFWGTSEKHTMPAVQSLEFDIRKMYIDEIRKETEDYQKICESAGLQIDPNTDVAKNIPIFQSEEKIMAKGIDFNYLDQNLNFYKGVRPSRATFTTIAQKFLPVVKLLTVSVADIYFCLTYGTAPHFPDIVPQCGNIPDLLLRGDGTNQFVVVTGHQYLNDLLKSYSTILVRNLDVGLAVKFLPAFQKLALPGAAFYEAELLSSVLSPNCPPEKYTAEQKSFMELLSRQPQNYASSGLKQVLEDWKKHEKSVQNSRKEINLQKEEKKKKTEVKKELRVLEAKTTTVACSQEERKVSQPCKKEKTCLSEVCERNDPDAMVGRAKQYIANGGTSVQNYKLAMNLFLQAADQGNSEAALSLGYCHAWGLGGQADDGEAERFFYKAAELGNAGAVAALLKIYGACHSKRESSLSESMLQIISDVVDDKLFLRGQIPFKKLINALEKYKRFATSGYSQHLRKEVILALYDNTVFGAGDHGFLITYAGFLGRNLFDDKLVEFNWEDINDVNFRCKDGLSSILVNGQRIDVDNRTKARCLVKMILDLRNIFVNYFENYGKN